MRRADGARRGERLERLGTGVTGVEQQRVHQVVHGVSFCHHAVGQAGAEGGAEAQQQFDALEAS